MGQVLIRNLSDATIEKLKARAEKHGRSLEAELRAVLEEVAAADHRRLFEVADRIRARTKERGWDQDSTKLIREDRDR